MRPVVHPCLPAGGFTKSFLMAISMKKSTYNARRKIVSMTARHPTRVLQTLVAFEG